MHSLIRAVPSVVMRQPTAGPTAADRLVVPAATASKAASREAGVKGRPCGGEVME
jgi:hypothetical protein